MQFVGDRESFMQGYNRALNDVKKILSDQIMETSCCDVELEPLEEFSKHLHILIEHNKEILK